MNSFYILFYNNKQPISHKIINKIKTSFSWWNPDKVNHIIPNNYLFIGQSLLYNTPESKKEILPLQDNRYIISADARIDNREQLYKQLNLKEPIYNVSDSKLILESYKKWDDLCVNYLLGDFSFIIWDTENESFFCARDIIGTKPLYYSLNDNIFFASTDLKGMINTHIVPDTINDKSIANYIANKVLTLKEETFFKNIKKLKHASFLKITKDSSSIHQYWSPKQIQKNNTITEQEAIKTLKQLLTISVKDRLRSDFPIVSHLSGGIDSSAITGIAAKILQKHNSNIITFSWHYPPNKDEERLSYEWNYILQIVKKYNTKHHFIKLNSKKLLSIIKNNSILYDSSHLWYEYFTREETYKYKARTILSGWGGDEIISHHGYAIYSDLLIHLKFKKLYHEIALSISTKEKKIKHILKIIYFKILIPFLPNSFYCFLPKIKCPKLKLNFLTKKYQQLVKTAYSQKNFIFARATSKTIHQDLLRALDNGHLEGRIEAWYNASLKYHIEYRYPLLDKRIIEFALSLPGEFFYTNNQGRYLYKKAIEGVLPSQTIWECKKREPKRIEKLHKIYLEASKDKLFNNLNSNTKEIIKSLKEIKSNPRLFYILVLSLIDKR